MESLLKMNHFNSLDWTIDEAALFADNRKTGERILLERFESGARLGIVFSNSKGTMIWGESKWDESKYGGVIV